MKQRLAERIFEDRTYDEGKDKRGRRKFGLSHNISDPSKHQHDECFVDVRIEAVGADQAEKKNNREEHAVGRLENSYPHSYQGQVENEKHRVPHVHGTDDAPKHLRMLSNEK